MQLPNNIPILNSVKSVILGKSLVIFKVGYLPLDKTYINQNCWNYSTIFALLNDKKFVSQLFAKAPKYCLKDEV